MTRPIAFVTGYHDGYPVVQPVDGAAVLPTGMALYDRPAPDVQFVALMNIYPDGRQEFHNGKDNDADYAVPVYLHPPAADVQELVEALRQLCSIVEIHQDATGNNFAWAELPDAFEALAKWEGK